MGKLGLPCPIHFFKKSSKCSSIACVVQPWVFMEIKEQRHWDISSGERLNILKDFVHFGLEHWGSDTKGIIFYGLAVLY